MKLFMEKSNFGFFAKPEIKKKKSHRLKKALTFVTSGSFSKNQEL